MSDYILQVKGLHTLYGESHILHGLSFDVKRGQTVSIMGRNGMGKSTTLKSVLGIVKPRSGSVLYKGEDIGWLIEQIDNNKYPFRMLRHGDKI